jgi:hypothetical protein
MNIFTNLKCINMIERKMIPAPLNNQISKCKQTTNTSIGQLFRACIETNAE